MLRRWRFSSRLAPLSRFLRVDRMNEAPPQNEFAGLKKKNPNTSARNYTWQPAQGIKFDGAVQQQTRQVSQDNASSRPGPARGVPQVIAEDAKAPSRPTLNYSTLSTSASVDKSPQATSTLLANYAQDHIAPTPSQEEKRVGIALFKNNHWPKLHRQITEGYYVLYSIVDDLGKRGILKSTKGFYIEDECRQLIRLGRQISAAMHRNRAAHRYRQAILSRPKSTGIDWVIAEESDRSIAELRSFDDIDESVRDSVTSISVDVWELIKFFQNKPRRHRSQRYDMMLGSARKLNVLKDELKAYRTWRNKILQSEVSALINLCAFSLKAVSSYLQKLASHYQELLRRRGGRYRGLHYKIKRRAQLNKRATDRYISQAQKLRDVLYQLENRERRKSTIAKLSKEPIPDESLSTNQLLHLKRLAFLQGKNNEHSLRQLDKPSLTFNTSEQESGWLSSGTSALGFQRTQPLRMSNSAAQLADTQAEPNQKRPDSEDTLETLGSCHRSPLGYHIPLDRLRASMRASVTTGAAYWQYILYEGPRGEKVKVHYCKSKETTERIAQLFLDQKILGFDLEWKAQASAQEGIRKNVALVQLASEERIALFHVARFSNEDKAEDLVAPSLKRIMESPDITKVGVSVRGDSTRLRKYLGFESQGLFELSHLYKLVKFSAGDVKKINKVLVSLASQVQEHLMLPLLKDQRVRASDWSEDLNYQQIYYAASDSYAGFQLFHILNSKRLELDPAPPLPSHLELNLPIRLANGQTVADYEESQEPPAEDPPSNPPTAGQTSLSPPFDQLNHKFLNLAIEDSPRVPETAPSTAPKSLIPPPSLSSHPAIVAANNWVLAYRTDSLGDSKNNIPKPRATPAFLRAYSLFHVQGKRVAEIAALLRKPPLKEATVAQYVLEAVRLERLEIGGQGLEECLGYLGDAVRVRYRGLVKRTGTASSNGTVESGANDQVCQLTV